MPQGKRAPTPSENKRLEIFNFSVCILSICVVWAWCVWNCEVFFYFTVGAFAFQLFTLILSFCKTHSSFFYFGCFLIILQVIVQLFYFLMVPVAVTVSIIMDPEELTSHFPMSMTDFENNFEAAYAGGMFCQLFFGVAFFVAANNLSLLINLYKKKDEEKYELCLTK